MPEFNPPASIFKALMHPSRLSILEILRDGEHCVCHLEAVLGCRQAYISQHLMALRGADILLDRREGRYIYYRLKDPSLLDLITASATLSGIPAKDVSALINKKSLSCECPHCAPVSISTESLETA